MSEAFDPYYVWLGIPPEEQPPNHYRLLGLRTFETNPDVISNAVDQRRTFLRSVQGGKRAAQSQKLLNEVSAAGVCLLDPAKKAVYDEELRKELAPPELPPEALPVATLVPQSVGSIPAAALPTATSPRRATPRGKKKRSSRDMTTAAMLVSGAAAVLVLAVAGTWWIQARQPASIAKTPAPRPPVSERIDEAPLPKQVELSPQPEAKAETNFAPTPEPPTGPEPQPQPKPKAKFAKPKAKVVKSAATNNAPSPPARPSPPAGDKLTKATEEARAIFASDLKVANSATQKGA